MDRFIHTCTNKDCRKEYISYVKSAQITCTCGSSTEKRAASEPEVRKAVEHARKRNG